MNTKDSTEAVQRHEFQARVFQALAHPIRLAIVEALRQGEVCVCEIAAGLGAERSNISRHLALMQRSGVLASRKEGLQVLYRLRTPCILDFLSCATRVARGHLEEEARAFGTAAGPAPSALGEVDS